MTVGDAGLETEVETARLLAPSQARADRLHKCRISAALAGAIGILAYRSGPAYNDCRERQTHLTQGAQLL